MKKEVWFKNEDSDNVLQFKSSEDCSTLTVTEFMEMVVSLYDKLSYKTPIRLIIGPTSEINFGKERRV
jgi:hypothetical protein